MAAIGFKNALGLHSNALQLRAQRSEILANNLANSDTPGFKARDINFQHILEKSRQPDKVINDRLHFDIAQPGELTGSGRLAKPQLAIQPTHQQHFATSDSLNALLYRTPSQPSIDGNTVDSQTEQAEFARNSFNYSASFEFLNGKFKGLRNAIRGE